MIIHDIADRIRGVAGDHNPNVEEAPSAILWPDPGGEWEPVAVQLQDYLSILTLGAYDPEGLTGPAIWLRCAVAQTVDTPITGIPVLYLPGLSREDLRGGDGGSVELAPLVELQSRSKWFVNPQGPAWTASAFFRDADRGLGLAVADGSKAQGALRSALPKLMTMERGALAGRVLDASFLHELVSPEVTRSILEWISTGEAPVSADENGWVAFCEKAKEKLGIDPATATPISAAALLGRREGEWAEAWRRYTESPEQFPGIAARLEQARPGELMAPVKGSWPQDSDNAESDLERALRGVGSESPEAARHAISDLWSKHQDRMGWIWTERLGRAPYVEALQYLAELAEATATLVGGETVEAVSAAYAEGGWRADDALLRALAQVPDPDKRDVVAGAAAALYCPWAEHGANAMQAAVGSSANSGSYVATEPVEPTAGTCFLFVDGLRFDLGHRLLGRLQGLDLEPVLTPGLAALPTVTPTAKLALTPDGRSSLVAGTGFSAAKSEGGANATLETMRSILVENGVSVLKGNETGDPATGSGWAEIGRIDARGHGEGLGIVDFVDGEVDGIVRRIRKLLEAGWERVELVTDHGWVLSPRMLSKVDLPIAALEPRKGRCARLKEGAPASLQTVPWYWDAEVRVAIAPGMSCFEKGKFYEHGGVSPQECVVPRIAVERGPSLDDGIGEITEVKWINFLCRIRFSGVPVGSSVDIRGLAGDASTSVAKEVRETSSGGKASLLIPDDSLEGEPAFVVILGPDGGLLAQRGVVIGRNG